jgi:hypothetical protein
VGTYEEDYLNASKGQSTPGYVSDGQAAGERARAQVYNMYASIGSNSSTANASSNSGSGGGWGGGSYSGPTHDRVATPKAKGDWANTEMVVFGLLVIGAGIFYLSDHAKNMPTPPAPTPYLAPRADNPPIQSQPAPLAALPRQEVPRPTVSVAPSPRPAPIVSFPGGVERSSWSQSNAKMDVVRYAPITHVALGEGHLIMYVDPEGVHSQVRPVELGDTLLVVGAVMSRTSKNAVCILKLGNGFGYIDADQLKWSRDCRS